ncbi:hypothetical protein JOM56_014832 [Amanita muscaria]
MKFTKQTGSTITTSARNTTTTATTHSDNTGRELSAAFVSPSQLIFRGQFATIAKAYEVPEMADPFDYHSYDNHTLLQDLNDLLCMGGQRGESSARACRPTRPMLSKVKPHALRALPASVGISGWCLDTLQGSTVGSFRRDWVNGRQ